MNKHTELLRLYNQWRRGDIEQLDFTPKEIGEAIDGVLEERAEMLEALSLCVKAMKTGMVDFNPHDEYVLERATTLLDKAEGEQE